MPWRDPNRDREKWNNKWRPAGTGTASRKRAIWFKEQGEGKAMTKNDKDVMVKDYKSEACALKCTLGDDGKWTWEKASLDKREPEQEPAAARSSSEARGSADPEPSAAPAATEAVAMEVEKKDEEKEEKKEEMKKEEEEEAKGARVNRNKKRGGPLVFLNDGQGGLAFGPSPAQEAKEREEEVDWGDLEAMEDEKEEKKPQANLAKRSRAKSFQPSNPFKALQQRSMRANSREKTLAKREKMVSSQQVKGPQSSKESLAKREEANHWEQKGHAVWRLRENPEYREQKRMVAVDYFNTLFVHGIIPVKNLDALWKLHQHGYAVHLLSFCGKHSGRWEDVIQHCQDLGFPWSGLNICHHKSGRGGKLEWLKGHKCDILFDDSPEVLEECHAAGIWVYAIETYVNKKYWHKTPRYATLMDAVEAFIKSGSLPTRP